MLIIFNSSFENINVVVCSAKSEESLEPEIFFWNDASIADAAVNSISVKTLLANGLSTFPLKANQVLVMVPDV